MSPDSLDNFTHTPKPPKLAEKLLAFFLSEEDKEVVLGDFEEAYFLIGCKLGVKQAQQWYWFELLKSMPALFFLAYKKLIRSDAMNRNNKLALWGGILVLPALLLVLGGLVQSGFGVTSINDVLDHNLLFFHPLVILGGLMLAFVLNLFPIVRVEYQDGVLVSRLTIKDRLLNISLVSCIGLLSAVIFLYLLAENFQLFQGVF